MNSILEQVKEDTHIITESKIKLSQDENKPIIKNNEIGVIVLKKN